jgi:hypothetical protein
MSDHLQPNPHWRPQDDEDYRPWDERPRREILFLFVLPWLLWFLIGGFFNLMH